MKNNGTNSRSRKSMVWMAGIALFALVLVACAPAATPAPTDTVAAPSATVAIPVTAPTATTAPTMGAVTEPTVAVATDPNLGQILVDGKGMTLYVFTKDTADMSTCTADCLKAWPALMTNGSPVAGTGVDATKLGSATLPGGGKIVTYNHLPLYYFAKDTKPGDTMGQNVGNVWYAVSAAGAAVMSTSSAMSPTATTSAMGGATATPAAMGATATATP